MPTMPKFEYDPEKGKSNKRKHGITFRQAQSIWNGRYLLLIEINRIAKSGEMRYKATGLMSNLVCIVVIYAERDRCIRLISARRAESDERETYYEQSGYTPSP
jgi:uncharacterized DUF497 family protein